MQQVWYQQLLAATWADLIRVVALPWSKAHDAELIQLRRLRPPSGYQRGPDATAPPRARVVVLSCDEERRRYPVKATRADVMQCVCIGLTLAVCVACCVGCAQLIAAADLRAAMLRLKLIETFNDVFADTVTGVALRSTAQSRKGIAAAAWRCRHVLTDDMLRSVITLATPKLKVGRSMMVGCCCLVLSCHNLCVVC